MFYLIVQFVNYKGESFFLTTYCPMKWHSCCINFEFLKMNQKLPNSLTSESYKLCTNGIILHDDKSFSFLFKAKRKLNSIKNTFNITKRYTIRFCIVELNLCDKSSVFCSTISVGFSSFLSFKHLKIISTKISLN